ncbi:TolC family protein [Mangrovimonas aestuarii]|uniref:TolC family protein n=1 Tax=Mangrovimonas aestuarii TaxID=3018443 RepID=UPI002378C1F0|nr:TolC family protein [Mangrovimonas aestuarii]
MRKLTIIICALIGFSSFGQTKKWTLQECVDYALENNISIKQSELDVKQAEINKKDAIGNFFPTLNGSGSHSWNIGLNQNITTGLLENQTTQFTSVGLTSGVDIFKGLQNLNRLHRENLSILASQYQLDNMKDDISIMVANAFLQILFNKEQLKVLQTQNNISLQELNRTQELVNAGALPKGDILEIQATIATQELQLVNAENAVIISRVNLAQLLLLEDYQTFDIVDADYDVPLSDVLQKGPEAIIEKAKDTRYDIKIAETNTEIAERDLQIARGTLWPTLRGFYNYSTRASYSDRIVGYEIDANNPLSQIGVVQGTGEVVVAPNYSGIIDGPANVFDQFSLNDGHNFGLQLSVPIFNGLSFRNNIKRNKVNLERFKYQLEQSKLDLESTVYQAYNDCKGASKAYEAAQKTLAAREQAFNYSQERYNVGLLNSFDYSQSQNQLEVAQSEVVRTKYDYIFKLKVLEYYFGIPITDIY